MDVTYHLGGIQECLSDAEWILANQIIKRSSEIFKGHNFIYAFFAILAYFSDA
jgi:hypothetical protein